jgi:hypothetical protein
MMIETQKKFALRRRPPYREFHREEGVVRDGILSRADKLRHVVEACGKSPMTKGSSKSSGLDEPWKEWDHDIERVQMVMIA